MNKIINFKHLILLVCLIMLFACSRSTCVSLKEWSNALTTEANIAQNSVALPNNYEFDFLDLIVKDKQIIILGELGHQDITTTETKINMISYLKKHKFNTIAFESAPFLSTYVFNNGEYAEFTKQKMRLDYMLLPLWTSQSAFKQLTDRIECKELHIYGIDSQSGIYDIAAAQAILKRHTSDVLLNVDWDKLSDYHFRHFIMYSAENVIRLSEAEQIEMMGMINEISNYAQYYTETKGATNDIKAIMQWIRNINTEFSYVKHNSMTTSDLTALVFRNRDSQMAENILWYCFNFPKSKFVVYCANFHGAKDVSQTHYPTDSLLYYTHQSMGETLFDKLGNKMYSLAFTSLNKDQMEPGKLEVEISKATNNSPYAYIDFEPLRFAKGYYNQNFECSAILKKNGNWLYIFDGIYYMEECKTSQD